MSTQKGKFVYAVSLPIRWSDMDDFGHVNNSVYLTYFEQARIDWWKSITPTDISFENTGPVIINAYCTFFNAITYPETLTVKLYVGPPGRSSYECYYDILSATQSELKYAEGSTKVVWVDRQLTKSVPLPEYIRKHLPAELK